MEAYAKHGLSLAYISKLLSRQRTTISRHLRAKLLDLKVQERLKYKKRTDRMVSQIVQPSVIQNRDRQIQRSLKFDVVVRRVQKILATSPYVRYKKRQPTVRMTAQRREIG